MTQDGVRLSTWCVVRLQLCQPVLKALIDEKFYALHCMLIVK